MRASDKSCPRCTGQLRRLRRSPLQRLIYARIYECIECGCAVRPFHQTLSWVGGYDDIVRYAASVGAGAAASLGLVAAQSREQLASVLSRLKTVRR